MPLPPPPSASVAAPAVAATGTTTSAPAATEKAKGAGFGPGRGEAAIPVPVINGVDSAKLIDAIHACILSNGVSDLAAVVSAFKATPKSSFPGNKHGRAAYNLGTILNSVNKVHDSLHKERAARGEGKPRVKQSDVFKALLKKLSDKLGGDAKLTEILGDEAAKFLAK